jgi:hypothetical protein
MQKFLVYCGSQKMVQLKSLNINGVILYVSKYRQKNGRRADLRAKGGLTRYWRERRTR